MNAKFTEEQQRQFERNADAWIAKTSPILNRNFSDLDLLLLKCHLVMEHELIEYIEKKTKNRIKIENAGFTFSHKMKIAKMLGCFEDRQDLEIFLTNLNKIRNQFAHKFVYDTKLLAIVLDLCKKNLHDILSDNQLGDAARVLNCGVSFFSGLMPE